MSEKSNGGRAIIIGGGVGPLAGVDLHRRIIELTPGCEKDQDHAPVIHLSFPSMIPDRTAALQEGRPAVPALAMADLLLLAEKYCEALNLQGVVGIPCNTFHAPPIWDLFISAMESSGSSLKILNMIELTMDHIRRHYARGSRVGVMSTTGTRSVGVFSNILAAHGYQAVQSADQSLVHQIIYDSEWGLKATAPVSDKALSMGKQVLDELISQGVSAVILGCTELPLAFPGDSYRGVPLINPAALLARNLVAFNGVIEIP